MHHNMMSSLQTYWPSAVVFKINGQQIFSLAFQCLNHFSKYTVNDRQVVQILKVYGWDW